MSFLKKTQIVIDSEKPESLPRKIGKSGFDFEDFLSQLQQIKKMGNLKDLMGMIPGVGSKIKDLDVDDKSFKALEL